MLTHLLLLCVTCINLSAQCLSRYITKPIQGHYCHQATIYKTSSDVSFQRCVGECINERFCWTLWYNHLERHCLLASETCVRIDINTEFSMAILRTNETTQQQNCIHWTPFSQSLGRSDGFPQRAVKDDDMKGTSVRAMVGQDMLTGWATDWQHKAYLIDWDLVNVELTTYEVLLVAPGCSTTWVPYNIGDQMPHGAVVAGVDRNMRKKYVVRRMFNGNSYPGSYTEGDAQGYFPENPVIIRTDFYILVVW